MSNQNSDHTIQGANAPRLKLGAGRLGAFDPAAIAKAEAALKSLSGNFAQWLQDEVAKLEAARETVRVEGATPQTLESLYMRAHDLKGLGTTYGYPLITRMAASLCKLTDDAEKRSQSPMPLIDSHIEAIRAAVRDEIKTDEHPTGRQLAEELERRVQDALA